MALRSRCGEAAGFIGRHERLVKCRPIDMHNSFTLDLRR